MKNIQMRYLQRLSGKSLNLKREFFIWGKYASNAHPLSNVMIQSELTTIAVCNSYGCSGIQNYVFMCGIKFLVVVTTVVVPLLLSYSVSVKGVFSPVPPYCGYSKPSHSFVIMLIYLVCLINQFNIMYLVTG